MKTTLQSKALDNLNQMIDATLRDESVSSAIHEIKTKVSIRAIHDEALKLCEGTDHRGAHGTAYIIFRKAWDQAYGAPKLKKERGFDAPPPTRGR